MKKAILFFSFLFIFASANYGQGISSVGVGFDLAIPSGDLKDALDLSMGIGGDVKAEYMFDEKMGVNASVGYISWSGENDVTLTNIPVVVGSKYYFNQGFYGLAEIGIHMLSYEMDLNMDDDNPLVQVEAEVSDEKFGFAIGGGYEMPLNETINLDLTAKYQFIEDFNNIMLRAGLKYHL